MFRRGSYANVASTLALVVALGGTSYAAIAIQKNSVGSKHIINNSVKGKDVKNGSLLSADFAAGQVPAGPAGPAGAAGAQGPVGPSNGYSVDSGTNLLDWTGASQTVSTLNLPAGSYVLVAKVMGNNNAASQSSMDCELRFNGTVVDAGSDVLSLESNLALDRAYMPLIGTATSAAASTATITCTASSTDGNWISRGITAVKVGAIG